MKILFVLFIMMLLYTTDNDQSKNNYVAHVFIDGKSVADYFVTGNQINKAIYFGESKDVRGEIYYIYHKTDKLTDVKFKGHTEILGSNKELEKKLFNDGIFQKKLINNKLNIHIPLQAINTNELMDISNIFSATTAQTDARRGDYREITINNINKKFRFYPSNIESYISSKEVVKRYKLNLRRDTILKEEIFFDKGLLTRTYRWLNNKTLIVRIDCSYKNNKMLSSTKKIELDYL
ncbi:MAG: hypothetical protein V4456_16375 [Bacteroidota bacterium]